VCRGFRLRRVRLWLMTVVIAFSFFDCSFP